MGGVDLFNPLFLKPIYTKQNIFKMHVFLILKFLRHMF